MSGIIRVAIDTEADLITAMRSAGKYEHERRSAANFKDALRDRVGGGEQRMLQAVQWLAIHFPGCGADNLLLELTMLEDSVGPHIMNTPKKKPRDPRLPTGLNSRLHCAAADLILAV